MSIIRQAGKPGLSSIPELSPGKGAIFYQDFPGGPVEYLGCHGVTGFTSDKGSKEYGYCFRNGEYVPRSITQSVPGGTSFSITSGLLVDPTPIELLGNCVTTFYIIHTTCGRVDRLCDFARASVVPFSSVNVENDGDLVAMTEDSRVERSFDVTSPLPTTRAFRPKWSSIGYALPDTEIPVLAGSDLRVKLDITGNDSCGGSICGPRTTSCDWILTGLSSPGDDDPTDQVAGIVASGDGGKTFYIKELVDGSGDPYLTPAIDFAYRLPNDGFIAVPNTSTTDGDLFVYLGSLTPGVNEVTQVEVAAVGTTNVTVRDVYALEEEVWILVNLGASATGRVYYSADGGLTWELQLQATTGDALFRLDFYEDAGYAIGIGGGAAVVYRSTNRGVGWSKLVVTGLTGVTAINAIFLTSNAVWLATNAGLYASYDSGLTWERRVVGAASAVSFYDDYFGVAYIGGRVHYTITGGAEKTWCALESQPVFVDANPTIHHMLMCSPSTFYLLATDGASESTQITKYSVSGSAK